MIGSPLGMGVVDMSYTELQHDVIEKGLCVRCGVCAGICPLRVIEFDEARYPILTGQCAGCGACTASCPGADVDFPALSRRVFGREFDVLDLQGHTENLFVAHATDPEIRRSGTSGGMVTALLLHLLEHKKIDGAVVVDFDRENPTRSRGILATTAEQIRSAAGSKYCLTPSMAVLQELRKREGRYAVVALPCQIHGLRKMEEADPKLSAKIACIFGLYCACNMEPHSHLEAIVSAGIGREEVARFDFRGGDWPGGYVVEKTDGTRVKLHSMSYRSVVNVLFRVTGAERCYLCVDGLSEYADLSFGDFHAFDYSGDMAKMEKCTLITQRTERGNELLRQAVEDGAISLHPLPREHMSKRILRMARGKRFRNSARLLRLRSQGKPVPSYHCTFPTPSASIRRSEFFYRSWSLLRGPKSRRLIMKVLFSPVGEVLGAINERRNSFF